MPRALPIARTSSPTFKLSSVCNCAIAIVFSTSSLIFSNGTVIVAKSLSTFSFLIEPFTVDPFENVIVIWFVFEITWSFVKITNSFWVLSNIMPDPFFVVDVCSESFFVSVVAKTVTIVDNLDSMISFQLDSFVFTDSKSESFWFKSDILVSKLLTFDSTDCIWFDESE